MDAALRLGRRHALDAVGAALVLEDRVRAVALDLERVLAVADVERLDLEPAALGVAAEHAEEVARPEPGLVAAGAALDLDDHVLVVVRVALDHREPDLLLELAEALAGGGEHLAQLRVVAVLGDQLLRRPAASSVARRHSSASLAAGSRRRYSRPTSA